MPSSQTTDRLTTSNGGAANEDTSHTPSISNKYSSRTRWYYPDEIANDLRDLDIPEEMIPEVLGYAWEFIRTGIPHYSNYKRYMAYARFMVIVVLVEFKGSLADIKEGDRVFGYDVEDLLQTVFGGTVYYEIVRREFRCFVYFTALKTSKGRDSDVFKQYADCLAHSPKTWFRFRDSDGLMRFSIAGALACNDYDDVWYNENELQILSEICMTMYDSVAYYKHRAEGETHNTFAYVGDSLRVECHRRCRETLWGLDAAWTNTPCHRPVINLIRSFSGAMKMTMRRYRFIEDGLTIGLPETEEVIEDARQNVKMWYRLVDLQNCIKPADQKPVQLEELEEKQFLFDGFTDILRDSQKNRCASCLYPQSYSVKTAGQFCSAKLCDQCRLSWQAYVNDFPKRAAEVFPFL